VENKKEKRLSRNILSGEVQGNVLRAQFSMRSMSATTCTEYLLKPEGDRPHPTSPADLRKNMRAKLSNELLPAKSMSSIEGLPNLQEAKLRSSSLATYSSLPNLTPVPHIRKPFNNIDIIPDIKKAAVS